MNEIITDIETIIAAVSLIAGTVSGWLGKRQREKRKKKKLNYTEVERQEILEIADKLSKNSTVFTDKSETPTQKPLDNANSK